MVVGRARKHLPWGPPWSWQYCDPLCGGHHHHHHTALYVRGPASREKSVSPPFPFISFPLTPTPDTMLRGEGQVKRDKAPFPWRHSFKWRSKEIAPVKAKKLELGLAAKRGC